MKYSHKTKKTERHKKKREEIKKSPSFHAYYRNPGPMDRKFCDHALFLNEDAKRGESQFARIDKYLFGLTKIGQDMFKCFLEDPDQLITKYSWKNEVIDEIKRRESWTGERLSYNNAMGRMKDLADTVINYHEGSILFVFSRKKINFNVEVYSTKGIDFIEGFLIASIDSGNYKDFFSLIINEMNIIEIECDYGLNKYPDDNPWNIIYKDNKLSFHGNIITPD